MFRLVRRARWWFARRISPTEAGLIFMGPIIDWLGSTASDISASVKSFVRAAIQWAVDQLEGLIDATTQAMSWALGYWVGILQAAIDGVSGALNWSVGVLVGLVNDARNFAAWLFDSLRALVDFSVGVLVGLIDGVQALAESLVDAALQFVHDYVYAPLHGLFDEVWHWATDTLPHWVLGQVNNLWCFVNDVANSIVNLATGVVNAALGPFLDVLNLMLRAIDWLTYFALHPFGFFRDLFDSFFTHHSTWLIGKVAASIQTQFSTVDDWLGRWFDS